MKCPACSSTTHEKVRGYQELFTCSACGALHGRAYLGDTLHLVHPQFVSDERQAELEALPDGDAERYGTYFDFVTTGSDGLGRRHGWYDPKTRDLLQVG